MSPSQLLYWIDRRPKAALTLALVYLIEHDQPQTVLEWPVSDLPATGLTLAAHILNVALNDCEAREIPSAQYGLRWTGAELAVLAQKVITVYPRNRVELVADRDEEHPTPMTGSVGAEILAQILRHKETESKQYHAGMQTILRAQQELIAVLRDENRELRELKKPKQSDAGQPEAEARAVALDKLTDMVVQHVGPKLPEYIDRAFTSKPKRIAASAKNGATPNGKH